MTSGAAGWDVEHQGCQLEEFEELAKLEGMNSGAGGEEGRSFGGSCPFAGPLADIVVVDAVQDFGVSGRMMERDIGSQMRKECAGKAIEQNRFLQESASHSAVELV